MNIKDLLLKLQKNSGNMITNQKEIKEKNYTILLSCPYTAFLNSILFTVVGEIFCLFDGTHYPSAKLGGASNAIIHTSFYFKQKSSNVFANLTQSEKDIFIKIKE